MRRVLSVLDGVVAGEGEGPLAPRDRPLGVVLAATDPVALDLVALRLMGFDERRIAKVREALRDTGPRLTDARSAADVRAFEADARTLQRGGACARRARLRQTLRRASGLARAHRARRAKPRPRGGEGLTCAASPASPETSSPCCSSA